MIKKKLKLHRKEINALPFDHDEPLFSYPSYNEEEEGEKHSWNDFYKQLHDISGVNEDLLGKKKVRKHK